jgi:hypothetical protein
LNAIAINVKTEAVTVIIAQAKETKKVNKFV